MDIVFRTTISILAEENFEVYTADIFLDGTEDSISISANSDEVDYEEFRANVFEDVLNATLEAAGLNLVIFDEEPFVDEDDYDMLTEYLLDEGDDD